MNIIENQKHWRISKSGCSIKTGWNDDKEIICNYHGSLSDQDSFNKWLDNAEIICDLYNNWIDACHETVPVEPTL